MNELAIGNVVKVNIKGEMMTCIILGNFMEYWGPLPAVNYLITEIDHDMEYNGYTILNAKVHLHNCYKTLIGDQIVYVEAQEIAER